MALPPLVPACALNQVGAQAPSLNCVLQVGVAISQIILGVAGALALLMFVYGGFLMLTSGMIQKNYASGKSYLLNALIGLIIIFVAGIAVRYFISTLGVAQPVVGQACSGGVNILCPDGTIQCGKCNK